MKSFACILITLVACAHSSPVRVKRQLNIDRSGTEPALAFGRGRNAVRIGLSEFGSLADTLLNAGAQALGANVQAGNSIDLGRRITQEFISADSTSRRGTTPRRAGQLAFTAQDIEDISTGFSDVLSTFFRPSQSSTSGGGSTGTQTRRGFDAGAAVSSINNFGDRFVDIFRRRSNGGVPQNSADDLVNSFSSGLENVVNALSGQAPARSRSRSTSSGRTSAQGDQLNNAIDSLRQSVNGIINSQSGTGGTRSAEGLSNSIGSFTNSLTSLLTNRGAGSSGASSATRTAGATAGRASAASQIETVSNSIAEGVNSLLSVFTNPRASSTTRSRSSRSG